MKDDFINALKELVEAYARRELSDNRLKESLEEKIKQLIINTKRGEKYE